MKNKLSSLYCEKSLKSVLNKISIGELNSDKFLYVVAPLISHCYREIDKTRILIENAHVARKVLLESVFNDLKSIFFPIVARICILEINLLKDENVKINNESNKYFSLFVEKIKIQSYSYSIIKKYPVLVTILTSTIEDYVSSKKQFLKRLDKNFEDIISQLLNNRSGVKLKKMKKSGDQHAGDSVLALTFIDKNHKKLSIIYKPRPADVDLSINQLYEWFYQKTGISQKKIKIIDKGDYSWSEYIPYEHCARKIDVSLFYTRLGALLAFSYFFGVVDIHYENVIAHAEYPVIVDYECFVQPFYKLHDADNKYTNVFQTSILPIRALVSDTFDGIDMSALSGKGDFFLPYKSLSITNDGTDNVCITRVQEKSPLSNNYPIHLNKRVNFSDYKKEFIQGFQSYYNAILDNKEYLLSKESILNIIENKKIRVVLRNTSEYQKLLTESYHPLLLSSEDKHLEYFNWLHNNCNDAQKEVVDYEIADLRRGNIPAFYVNSCSTKLKRSDEKTVNISILSSGIDSVYTRLKEIISENDRDFQIRLIESSFEAYLSNNKMIYNSLEDLKNRSKTILGNILESIKNSAFIGTDYVSWPTVKSVGGILIPGLSGVDLYEGASGIGLLYLYAGIVTKEDGLTRFAKQIKDYILSVFSNENLTSAGAFSGVPGIIYFLTHYYFSYKDKDILSALCSLVEKANTFIEQDNSFDIIDGISGYLLVLRGLEKLEDFDKKLIENAKTTSLNHLFAQYRSPGKHPNPKYCGIDGENSLLGFAHGVAGITYALIKIGGVHLTSLNNRKNKWVDEAISYLRENLSEKHSDWPDLRKGSNKYMVGWCNGSPGIGITFLEGVGDIPIAQTAINNILKKQLNTLSSSLCHGNSGNFDLLLKAKTLFPNKFADLDLRENAEQWLNTIEDIYQSRIYCKESIGIMTGVSGVAYQLLRFIAPDKTPSVLSLDTATLN